ncbi:FAD-dependent oxidoreductase [Tautonia plasticadhaerens]|uniref:Coenzyme A disulfide reductase n=1 Tax=Tautonia plasticadhaerens TaxID=2527974 RepID=A0A518HDS1_9BACT|nr:FAD-dependent oxidoreductase [Tautonia plasticadhaerens]QDV38999.1 Coenzyme A disulfide reductase [Tautonia plasticadhaerens]
MNASGRTIVIVGGVAGGASAAARARRIDEHARIILFEKDGHVSFANCGLPYYIGGEIADREKLLVAPSELLERRFRLDVRTRQEVVSIDRQAKTVTVRDHASGGDYAQSYDRLILAPGASPLVPPLEGADAPGVFTLRNLEDTDRIKAAVDASGARIAAVIGAGYIGLEMVEQLSRLGFRVALAELQPQILPLFDPEMVRPIEDDLRSRGVDLHLGDGIEAVLTGPDGRARGVLLKSGAEVDAEVVILGLGVRPNLGLARDAGLEVGDGPGGGIATNEFMQTSDPDIYAVGDAAEYPYGPTGSPMRVALAGPANRAGRIAGEHAASGRSRPMAEVFGTAIVRCFDRVAAMTGLTMTLARRLDRPARSVVVVSNNHAGYYPGAEPITLKLVYEPGTGKVLGAQALGGEGVDKRIDVIATSLHFGGTVADLAGLDLAYAPPFGAAKDPVHMAAFAACNQLDGLVDFVEPDADLSHVPQFVDVRTPKEVADEPFPGVDRPINIPLDELRDRINELDPSAETVVSCRTGVRSHVAQRLLRQLGFEKVKAVSGGEMVRSRAWRSGDGG